MKKLARTEKVRPAILREVRVYGRITFARAREISIRCVGENNSWPARLCWVLSGMVGDRMLKRSMEETDVWVAARNT